MCRSFEVETHTCFLRPASAAPSALSRRARSQFSRMRPASCRPLPMPAPSPRKKPAVSPVGSAFAWRIIAYVTLSSWSARGRASSTISGCSDRSSSAERRRRRQHRRERAVLDRRRRVRRAAHVRRYVRHELDVLLLLVESARVGRAVGRAVGRRRAGGRRRRAGAAPAPAARRPPRRRVVLRAAASPRRRSALAAPRVLFAPRPRRRHGARQARRQGAHPLG